MNSLKQLKERKAEILTDMQNSVENIEIFDSVKFENMKAELSDIEAKISEFEDAEKVNIKNTNKGSDKKMDFKNMLLSGQTVDLSKISNEGEMIKPDHEAIQKETFEATIEKKVEEECLLYAKVRKIMTATDHHIPVQAEKLDRLLNVKEMAQYQKDMPTYKTVTLKSEKYGLAIVASEELLEDNGYGLEQDIQAQLVEAFAKTMEMLIINGDNATGVEGLLTKTEVAKVEADVVGYDDIVKLIFALKKPYRKDSILIVSDEFMKQVMLLQDNDGQPLLRREMVDLAERDIDARILGVPVIVSPELPANVFAIHTNLQKAMVVGVRRGIQVKKSQEIMFLTDGVAFKCNCRIDMKVLDTDAIAVLKKQGA